LRCRWILSFALLLSAGCRSVRNLGPADAELLRYVPQETIALGGLRLQELRASPVFQKLPVQKQWADRKDIQELVAAFDGKNVVLIARGTFRPGDPEAKEWTIVDSRTALAGDPAAVRAAMDRRKNGGSPLALVTRVQALPRHNQVWAIADQRLAAVIPRTGNLSNLHKFFGPMQDLILLAEVGESLHATLTGAFATEKDAQELGVAARGILGLGRLSIPPNQPDLERLYDTVSVQQKQRSIQVEATVPRELIDRLSTLSIGR
jgi:hypothetical protein